MDKQFNPLVPTHFKFSIETMEAVNYTGQGATLPGVSLGTIEYSTRETEIQLPGEKLVYSPLDITFIVDENMTNYAEMYNWMLRVSQTDDAHLSESKNATLIIFDRSLSVSKEVLFTGCIPFSLSEMRFSVIDNETVLVCNVSLEYDKFTFLN